MTENQGLAHGKTRFFGSSKRDAPVRMLNHRVKCRSHPASPRPRRIRSSKLEARLDERSQFFDQLLGAFGVEKIGNVIEMVEVGGDVLL